MVIGKVSGICTIVAYQYLPTHSYHIHQQKKMFKQFYLLIPSSGFLPPLKTALIPHMVISQNPSPWLAIQLPLTSREGGENKVVYGGRR